MPLTIVNTSVVSFPRNSTLLHWTILQIADELHNFFNSTVKQKVDVANFKLLAAQVGPDKNSLDEVDINLPITQVVPTFGKFVKYIVESVESSESTSSTNSIQDSSSSDNSRSLFGSNSRT